MELYIATNLGISQDRMQAHTSTVAMTAIQKCGFHLVEDPPYSPDLAPSD